MKINEFSRKYLVYDYHPIFKFMGSCASEGQCRFFQQNQFFQGHIIYQGSFYGMWEWGGHIELSKIYLSSDTFYIDYVKFEVDCSGLSQKSNGPVQKLILRSKKQLTIKGKSIIKTYIHQLIDAKLREPYLHTNAGCQFEIWKHNSDDLKIVVFTRDKQAIDEYINFTKKLLH